MHIVIIETATQRNYTRDFHMVRPVFRGEHPLKSDSIAKTDSGHYSKQCRDSC
jgi:hypothetical protein